MCTVTFIPVDKKVFITHSRDEKNVRQRALPPAISVINDEQLLFPKDGKADGSWVGCSGRGKAAVLLNGAFRNHIPAPPYRMSRGLIFLELLAAADLASAFTSIDLAR